MRTGKFLLARAQRLGESEACAAGDVRNGAGLVPGTLLRPNHAAFTRETAGGTWDRVELHLGAGGALVAKRSKRGTHRRRWPRRPMPGMLLHIDGSQHGW